MKMRTFALGSLTAGMLLLASLASAGVLSNRPESYGKPFGEWMELYWTWQLGGPQADHVGKVVFLPLPNEALVDANLNIYGGEIDVKLRPGQPFVLPMFTWIGEAYDPVLTHNAPPDNPKDIPAAWFTDPDLITVVIKLDGKVIINSANDDLTDFFFHAQYFDQPIVYPAPTSYGSDSAIWAKGIGFLHTPLAAGGHKLELFVYADNEVFAVGYANTWNITVK